MDRAVRRDRTTRRGRLKQFRHCQTDRTEEDSRNCFVAVKYVPLVLMLSIQTKQFNMYLVASRQYPPIMNMCVHCTTALSVSFSLALSLYLPLCLPWRLLLSLPLCFSLSVSSPFASLSVCLFHSVSLSPSHLLCLSLVLVSRLSLPLFSPSAFSSSISVSLLSLFLFYPKVSPLCLPLTLFRFCLFHPLYLILCLTPYVLPSDFFPSILPPSLLYLSRSDSPPPVYSVCISSSSLPSFCNLWYFSATV